MNLHARTSTAPATVTDAGALTGQLVPWNTTARVADSRGGPAYFESFAPGSLNPLETVPVYAGHVHTDTGELERGPLIGRVSNLETRDDGLYGTVQLAATTDAQTIRELARTVGAAFSIEYMTTDDEPRPGSTVVRSDGILTGLSVILPPQSPAYPTAKVTNIRSDAMSLTDLDPTTPAPEPEPDEPTEPEAPDDDIVLGRVSEVVRAEMARYSMPAIVMPSHPLARYNSLVEAADAAFEDKKLARTIGRALADQITTNSPGVIPPAWVQDVKGIVDLGRRVVTALGTNPDPGEGLDLTWPYYDGNLLGLVGVQVGEKQPITSARVDLKRGNQPLVTYAGGSDISYQLIRRSSPSYRDAYLRIMAAAYAAVTDKAASDQLEAASTAGVVYDVATDADGSKFRAAVFEGSVMVEDATGSPASVVLASTSVFVKVGAAMTPAPVVNVGGTSSASSLSVDVSQLPVVRAPSLTPGSAIVTNKLAAAWAEDFAGTITAEDIEQLGQNVAVWGMGALATFYPAGVVTLDPTGTATASSSKKK